MTVWLCSGQGAQKPMMGIDMLDIPEFKEVFDRISDGLGIDLAKVSAEGSQDQINDARCAQALTAAVSMGIGHVLKANGINPSALIGFSLGQISALDLAGALSLDDTISLLDVRSQALDDSCKDNEGAMLALMGANLADATALCEESAQGDVLVCANHNAPGQIVISGDLSAIERAEEAWKAGGKRAVRLATAGAFHSPLMQSAADTVQEFCETLEFSDPQVTLICNTDAEPFVAQEAAKRLGKQVSSGVLFEQSIRSMLDAGERTFVEVGFGGVLTNLVKRISKDAGIETQRYNLSTREALDDYIATAKQH